MLRGQRRPWLQSHDHTQAGGWGSLDPPGSVKMWSAPFRLRRGPAASPPVSSSRACGAGGQGHHSAAEAPEGPGRACSRRGTRPSPKRRPASPPSGPAWVWVGRDNTPRVRRRLTPVSALFALRLASPWATTSHHPSAPAAGGASGPPAAPRRSDTSSRPGGRRTSPPRGPPSAAATRAASGASARRGHGKSSRPRGIPQRRTPHTP